MDTPFQVQVLRLLTELLDTFNFNRKMILFNGMLITVIIFNGVMNYMNTRETTRLSARILELLEKAEAEKAERDAAELRQYRSGEK